MMIVHPEAPPSVRFAAVVQALGGIAMGSWLLLRDDGSPPLADATSFLGTVMWSVLLAWGIARLEAAPYWLGVTSGAAAALTLIPILMAPLTERAAYLKLDAVLLLQLLPLIHGIPTALVLVLSPAARRAFSRRGNVVVARSPAG